MEGNGNLRKFIVVWSGQLMSAIGSGLTAFALGVYVFRKTQSAMSYSFIILFAFLPAFILVPAGGVFADRFDRRKMMIVGDAGAILGILYILISIMDGDIQLWQIYTGVALSSVFTAIQNPAYKASVTDMVDEDFYSQASGLIQLAGSAQYLVSPVLAGVLLGLYEIEVVLLIDVFTFAFAIAAVYCVKDRESDSRNIGCTNFIVELKEGLAYLKSQKGVLTLVLLTSLVCFYIALFQSLFGPMMLAITDSKTLGIALSLSASGMLFGSLFIGIRGIRRNILVLTVSLASAGLFYALVGVCRGVPSITIFCFLFFCTLPFVNTALEVLIRSNIDDGKQGRIWSLVYAISQAGYIVAFASAGFLADRVFNPFLYPGGLLSDTAGLIVGVGKGRGIGLMFLMAGLIVSILALIIGRSKIIKTLECGQIDERINREMTITA